jgi:hypothetical protein
MGRDRKVDKYRDRVREAETEPSRDIERKRVKWEETERLRKREMVREDIT